MKILWIEDFAGNPSAKLNAGTVKQCFGTFVSSIEDDLNILQNIKSKTEELKQVLLKNIHPIHWCDGFISGLQAINEDGPFDIVLLDADLPFGYTVLFSLKDASENTNKEIERLKKEGLYPEYLMPTGQPQQNKDTLQAGRILYFYLIQHKGYDPDRIIFLSAHLVEESGIKEAFHEAKAVSPTIFIKDTKDKKEEFVYHLESFANKEYIT